MLADSLPQAGHDYILSTCLIISGENLEKCFQAKQSLQVSWEDFLAAYSSLAGMPDMASDVADGARSRGK